MDDLIVRKEMLPKWSHELADYKIFAPQRKDGAIVFDVMENVNQVILHYSNSVKPPKEVFFPQTQTLFEYEKGAEPKITDPKGEPKKSMLWGVRPCDARSFLILDRLFYWDYEDDLYKRARDNTVIVGLACTNPHHNCFCTSVGGAPYSKEGLDVLLTDLGDRYYVELLTKRGEETIRKPKELFTKATDEDRELRDRIQKQAEDAVTKNVDVEGVKDKLGELFESQYWDKKASTCIGCGICTLLCPTCHCFDISDEEKGTCGKRIRTWDTCMDPDYTVHASGYNPRPGKKNRMRNRVYHKFRYYPQRFDVTACVGCGRCITKCATGIDITDILREVMEVEE